MRLRNAIGRVRESVTNSDLYFLADRYLELNSNDSSPAVAALRQAQAADAADSTSVLGPLPLELFGCDHPHLLPIGPYEEFERHVRAAPITERAAEFKIYLAEFFDRHGIPAEAMGVLAEPAARLALGKASISDIYDWRSILAAYAKLDNNLILTVIPQ